MIAEMLKIQIAAPRSDAERLLSFLQEEEVVHLTQAEKFQLGEAAASQTGYQLAQLQFALEFTARIRKELDLVPKKSLRNMFVSKPAARLAQLIQTFEELPIETLLSEAHAVSETLNQLSSTRQQLEDEVKTLEPWKSLELRGKDLESLASRHLRHFLVATTNRHEESFTKALSAISTCAWQEVARVADKKFDHLYYEIICHEDDAQMIQQIITSNNGTVVTLELHEDETMVDRINTLNANLEETRAAYDREIEHAKKFLKLERKLQFAYDALLHRQEREAASQTVAYFDHSVVLTGWIPKMWRSKFADRVANEFPDAAVEDIEIAAGDKPPVMFVNSKAIQPFEAVTNIYGKPGYHELDPSGPLSIFFLLAFGLALTDAGYGIVMMIGTLVADRFFRLKKDMRKMVRLLFLGGASTTILGALTGGWFGIALENLSPSAIRDLLLSIKLLDPVQEPLKLLAVAFAIGILQLLFAWGVRGYYMWKVGQKTAAIIDNVPWITIIVLILAWAAAGQGILNTSLAEPLKWALYVNAGVLILTQGRTYKNPLLKVGGGVLSLYGLISFLSDMLSYSRLLALGLATGIIGFVVNLLAGMAIEMVPVVGVIAAVILLVVGHIMNLGINALGAFIHSGRLQFVEFFPKFLEGGGVAYKPFGRVSKYVDNPKEFDA